MAVTIADCLIVILAYEYASLRLEQVGITLPTISASEYACLKQLLFITYCYLLTLQALEIFGLVLHFWPGKMSC